MKRTAALLTFNGLLATTVAAGDRLPDWLKQFVAVMMFAVTAVWVARAVSIWRFIAALTRESRRPEYDDVLPAHVRVHREHTARRWGGWFNSTTYFSVGIPAALLAFWLAAFAAVR